MKLLKIFLLLSLVFGAFTGCKKFLTIEPIDRLTGNNFYKNKDDVEANIARIYSKFFDKLNESWVIGGVGEARTGEILPSPKQSDNRMVMAALGKNLMLDVINNSKYDSYALKRVTYWDGYYDQIQDCNILIAKLNEGIPGLSDTDKNRYIAEATFMRCFTYFWMVRLYGDVVYYTAPYFATELPRADMVSVVNACIEELMSVKNLAPWRFADVAERGARAGRGSIIGLLMNMHMWNAGFDAPHAKKHYEETAKLGKELRDSKVHKLYPLTEEAWAEVVKGKTEESLFEFYRSINYNDQNSPYAPFWDHFLKWPYKFPRHNNEFSIAYFTAVFLKRIYPENGPSDKRKELWYENMYMEDGSFVLKKYATNVYASGNEDANPDNSFIMIRYADAILLEAEALANLDRDEEAIPVLNLILDRANSPTYSGEKGTALKDFIFEERCRELIGEGVRFFDLIRTKRILNPKWSSNPMTLDQFNRRAWTWPLDASARNYNPKIKLNEYWSGLN